jgi:uncharacterized OB-fold protein
MSVEDHREEWDGPVPEPTGSLNEAFWEATLEGELLIQECPDCGNVQYYPRALCTECGAMEPDFVESDGVGTVYAYTVCHIPGDFGFAERTPYAVATVELAEGPRMLVFVDADPEAVEVETPVEITFWQVSDDAAIPVARPR